jgi:hypothetical protein
MTPFDIKQLIEADKNAEINPIIESPISYSVTSLQEASILGLFFEILYGPS